MAGLTGNKAWFMAQAQTARGAVPTVATAKAYKNAFTGGNIGPTRAIERLSETDSSRDAGNAYVSSVGVEGSPEFYVRNPSVGFWLWTALGSAAVPTGAGPYVHALTPNATLPYITVWRDIADTLFERYNDCKVSSLTLSADAGSPLTASAAVVGASATRLTADPSTSPAINLETVAPHNYNNATIAFTDLAAGAGAPAGQMPISSFELTIDNNVSRQQTDDVQAYDVVEGARTISLGFNLILENIDWYRRFLYAWSGTGSSDVTPSSTIYETAATFTFTNSASDIVSFNIPKLAFQEFPIEPNTAGDPIIVNVRGVANRNSPSIITASVTNSQSTQYIG